MYDSSEKSPHIEKHLNSLFALLKNKQDPLRQLTAEGVEIFLSVVVFCYDEPIVSLRAQDLKILSSMSAGVDIDIHLTRKDENLDFLDIEN